jgi:hypothetical protein
MDRKTIAVSLAASALGIVSYAQAGPPVPSVEVTGSVSVDNFPASQNVQGTVSVDSLPAIQGSVSVTNDATSPASVQVENGVLNPVPVVVVGGSDAGEYFYGRSSGTTGDWPNIDVPTGKVLQIKGFSLSMEGLPDDPRPDARYRFTFSGELVGGGFAGLTFFSGSECAEFFNSECYGTTTQQLDAFPPIRGGAFAATGFVPTGTPVETPPLFRSWETTLYASYWGVLFDAPSE